LQNAVISNVFNQATSFRLQQNHLSKGLRGALGVTYIPPAPELARQLMDQHGKLSNSRRKQYQYKVPEAAFDALETAYNNVMGE